MIFIDRSLVTLCKETGTLVVEASTAQIKGWPDFIAVTSGNTGFMFMKGQPDVQNGDVMGYRYYDRTSGARLLVIND